MIDAGLVAPAETIRIPEDDWLLATREELDSIRRMPLYANQQYRVERHLETGDILFRVRYQVPCITTLKGTP